jgi:putative phage-type endonuclease
VTAAQPIHHGEAGDQLNKRPEADTEETPMPAKALRVAHEDQVVPAAPASDAANIMHLISRLASDPSIDIDRVERFMEMHERVKARDAYQAFADAMSAAQAEMGRIATDRKNDQTKSRYASYGALDAAVRPVYVKHGFALSFNTDPDAPADHLRLRCKVTHRDGHCEPYQVDMPADGKGAKGGDVMTKTHAAGSAMSYGQRYLLKMIFNLAVGEDDDGQKACRTAPQHQISGAGEAAINSIRETRSLPDMEAWKAKNDDMVQKLDRNDRAAFMDAWKDHARANYAAQLICERLTGVCEPTFSNAAMQWGTDQEPNAREAYEYQAGTFVEQVAFIDHPTIAMSGASPDGMVGADGMLEIKCPNTATHLDTLTNGKPAAKYITQMQWQMACACRAWCDFVSYDPRLPEELRLFVTRVERDDAMIADLEAEVAGFLAELDERLAGLTKRYGAKLAIAA